MRRILSIRTASTLIVLTALPLLDLVVPQSARITALMPPLLIFALVAIGLNVVTGFTGMLHLGVAAFMAIGAWSFSILSTPIYPFQFGFWISLICAGVIASGAGAILAIPTMRLRGDYLAIVTLGFGEIVQDIIRNLDVITKGTQGINPVATPQFGTFEVTSINTTVWYYIILAIVALAAYFIEKLEYSHVGRAWMAIRDDELAATCMGVPPVSVKLSAFALCAGLAGIGGALLSGFLGSSGEPSNYDFQISIMTLAIVIVGGLGSVAGSIVGAVVMMGLNSIILPKISDALMRFGVADSSSTYISPGNWKYLIFGLALVLMMRWKNEGLLPARPHSKGDQ